MHLEVVRQGVTGGCGGSCLRGRSDCWSVGGSRTLRGSIGVHMPRTRRFVGNGCGSYNATTTTQNQATLAKGAKLESVRLLPNARAKCLFVVLLRGCELRGGRSWQNGPHAGSQSQCVVCRPRSGDWLSEEQLPVAQTDAAGVVAVPANAACARIGIFADLVVWGRLQGSGVRYSGKFVQTPPCFSAHGNAGQNQTCRNCTGTC